MSEDEIQPKLEAFAKAAEKHFNPAGDSALAIIIIVAEREEDGDTAVWTNSSTTGAAVLLSETCAEILQRGEDDGDSDMDEA